MPDGADAAGDGDEEVIIEEMEPDSGTFGATDGAAAAAAVAMNKEANAAKDESAGEDDEIPEGTSPQEAEMLKIDKEKKTMSASDKLERSILWKAEGNDLFKKNEIFKAVDCYYHAILYCRELMSNPQYYPKLEHNDFQRKTAQDLCESVYTNLALVQTKYANTLAPDDAEMAKVLEEAVKSGSEALKINAKNVKAMFRRGMARSMLAKGAKNVEAQKILADAKADFLAVLAEDPQNRDARVEAKAVQERIKALKKEEAEHEGKTFAFGATLSGIGAKEKDLLGDGSVKKRLEDAGDGGVWMNEDWLAPDAAVKCVVHITCAMLSSGGDEGKDVKCGTAPVNVSFILGDTDMHEGIGIAARSMTIGEVANFTMAPTRLRAEGNLASLLPDPNGVTSVWQIKLLKFVIWQDTARNGERLQKIQEEGYGRFPEELSEVFVHWRVFGPDGSMVHSSRNTIDLRSGTAGGLKQVEDEDKEAPCYVLSENCWEPLAIVCRSLRQGGVGELRMKRLPPLPKEEPGGDATASASAQLSMMMNKFKSKDGKEQDLRHCTVRAELERVVPPLAGPEDARWEGVAALVQERYRAELLLERGAEAAGLVRLRRVVAWAAQLTGANAAAVASEAAAARASIGWVLACRAAPILDLGNVTSDVLAAARRDLQEAEDQCAWLEEHHPNSPGTRCLRAKILVAQDDDFAGAHAQLLEAQKVAPDDKRVQQELRKVKIELRNVEEQQSRAQVVEIRDSLKRARSESSDDAAREEAVVKLLRQLETTRISWETVMETRIGVELKSCQDGYGAEAQRLCAQILGRLKDESKEQRPMWES